MPFADDPQTDPLTGECRRAAGPPAAVRRRAEVYAINTSAEYWRGDASLAHTDVAGTRDVEPLDRGPHLPVRRDAARHRRAAAPDGRRGGRRGVHGFNAVDFSPLTRAALLSLDAWVSDGIEPRRTPSRASPTARRRLAGKVIERFRAVPGVTVPDGKRLSIWRTDLGSTEAEGVAKLLPARLGERYQTYVSQVDADLNEMGGISSRT